MLRSYLKLSIKVLLRRKFFTAISLFGISFTLMVLMVSASIIDQALGPHAPAVNQNRMLAIYSASLSGPHSTSTSSPGYYLLDHFARDLPGVQKMSIFADTQTATSWVEGRKIETTVRRSDGAFWQIFRFDFVAGGPYGQEDDDQANFVAVINETTRRRFFGDAPAVGRSIEVDGQSYRVVGVVRDVSLLVELPFAEMWVPTRTTKVAGFDRQWLGGFRAAFLFAGSGDFAEARSELRSRLDHAQVPDPQSFDNVRAELQTRAERASSDLLGSETGHPLAFKALIVIAMLLFMLLPAVNLVNLNLSRILERAVEIGVRKSFGASSRSLVAQFLVENLALTLLGGAIGLGLSALVLRAINASGWLPYGQHELHPRVFLYGLALAVVFGLISGVGPAWRMSRLDPVEALRGRAA